MRFALSCSTHTRTSAGLFLLGLFFVFGFTFAPAPARAESAYSAELVSQSYTSVKAPKGKAFTIEAKFKNTGTATWKNSGRNFVALNVTGPAGRTSAFQHSFWKKAYRPALLKEPSIKPGETGTFLFAMQSPNFSGEFLEHFGLVAENLTWIEGGDLTLSIRVGNPKPRFRGEVEQAPDELTIEQGATKGVTVFIKNTGSAHWTRDGNNFIALNVADPVGRTSAFHNASWTLAYRPSLMEQDSIDYAEEAMFDFSLTAPRSPGVYEETFALVAEDLAWIPGTEFTITITVPAKSVEVAQNQPLDLRVGVYHPELEEATTTFTVSEDAAIRDGAGALLLTLANDEEFTVTFANGMYSYSVSDGTTGSTASYIRIIPESPNDAITTIVSKESTYNEYRGIVEYRYAEESQELWVIDELPLELYLRGLGETSNASHDEFKKALVTAARTYALFLYNSNTKHASQNFHLTSTSVDQLYLGYAYESKTPRLTEAVTATEGTIVTYNNEVALTPYFSQSDGRTYAYEEVWGPTTKYGYLVSVDDPCCDGELLLGHGVGLSAVGALWFATEEAKTWDWILGYYYPTTVLQKIY